jgi:hypothetical protein
MMQDGTRGKNRTGAYVIEGHVWREGPLTFFIE